MVDVSSFALLVLKDVQGDCFEGVGLRVVFNHAQLGVGEGQEEDVPGGVGAQRHFFHAGHLTIQGESRHALQSATRNKHN